jgi:predicted NBD/HSP70 family sugar kinase
VDDLTYVKIGTGIGSGHIVGGRLYRGSTGAAGEIGHIALDPQGAPCLCGLRGCLCTFVGAHPLVLRAAALRAEHPESRLASGDVSLTAIEDAALAGDALANQLVREAAGHLAVAIASMLNVLNPAMVIIGGGLSRVGEILLTPLRTAVRSRAVVWSSASAQIVTSPLGSRAVALGAATLALESALADLKRFPFARAVRGG